MPSFDVVSEVNMHEVNNAVDQANKEVSTRFDFKDSGARYTLGKNEISLVAQSDFQLKQMLEIIQNKLSKRGIALGSIVIEDPEITLKEARQKLTIKQGIEAEIAKEITKTIKASKLKVQASIQGEQIRITGKKRDDLQEAIALLRKQNISLPLQYINFRD